MSASVKIFVPVPDEHMRFVIGPRGSNIKRIQQETQTRITKCCETGTTGFFISGSSACCQKAELTIKSCVMSASVKTFVPVPEEYMGFVIGPSGSNIKRIQQETQTRITKSCETGTTGFFISGSSACCQKAELTIKSCAENIPGWLNIYVAGEYISRIVGKGRVNLAKIETNSKTRIKVFSHQNADAEANGTVRLEIRGPQLKNCLQAERLIRSRILALKEKEFRNELGGDRHFLSFAFKGEVDRFCLKPDESVPKLNGTRGIRHRIVAEVEETDLQIGVSDKTISEIEMHLLTSLENLEKKKDEKKLMADLWCHFGKVLVSNVDEDDSREVLTPGDIDTQLRKQVNQTTNNEMNDNWDISFVEGVLKSDINEDALPKDENTAENHGFFCIKLIHTQWRYDLTFVTPTDRNVRLKAWEGLHSDCGNEPPDEVKNILRPVSIQDEDSIKAWICYPSTSVLRGEIITPNSKYDCRMKLRAGPRHVIDTDSVRLEEDESLAHYISNCRFDKESHHIYLPERHEQEEQNFECRFYRKAKERKFEATFNEECFTFTVLDQNRWDSDSMDKREEEKYGIRVVMNSWSKKLLSCEWTPEEISNKTKLETYMTFLSALKDLLFKCP